MEKTIEERLTMVENALAQFLIFGASNFEDIPLAVRELIEYVEIKNSAE